MNRSRRVAVALSLLGLQANVATFVVVASMLFFSIEEWAVGVAYALVGCVSFWWMAGVSWHRTKAMMIDESGREASR